VDANFEQLNPAVVGARRVRVKSDRHRCGVAGIGDHAAACAPPRVAEAARQRMYAVAGAKWPSSPAG
jgi:hypothetical protein